ncbi:MAG: hypothetical protein JO255_21310, partial [Alphaproteobacteria bacterium]|nr:hypothetical protein [Alphaproteobacteria bacterium]
MRNEGAAARPLLWRAAEAMRGWWRPTRLSGDFVALSNDLLIAWDAAGVLAAGYFSMLLYDRWFPDRGHVDEIWASHPGDVLMGAVLVAAVMHDRRFGSIASIGQTRLLFDTIAPRVAILVGGLLALGFVTRSFV